MPLRPNLIRIVRVAESRNLPLQLLGHASRCSSTAMVRVFPIHRGSSDPRL